LTIFDPSLAASASLEVLAGTVAGGPSLERLRQVRWRRLLQAARGGTRLYRERLRGLPDDALPEMVPPVSKAELMTRFDEAVTDPRLSLAALRAFTADPARLAQPFLDRYLVWESSGTSGEPAVFVQDAAAMAVYDALELLRPGPAWAQRTPATPQAAARLLDPWGLTLRHAFVGVLEGHFASQVSVQRLRALNPWAAGRLRSFSILQPWPDLLGQLQDWAPQVLATYPTVAALLCDATQQGALSLPLLEVRTGGETLGVAARRRIARQLQCPVRDHYGTSEFLPMAWECALGRLHLNADWLLLEPVDERLRPVPAGVLSDSCLLTNLANRVQPLIRYELGDRIRLFPGRCGCGSRLPVVEVEGRDDPPLVLDGGDGRRVHLLPLALTTVLEEQAGVFDFQLRQLDAQTLVLRLGGPPARARELAPRCHAALQAYARAQGAARLRLIDECGQPVPRGRSGKARRVVGPE
jgi:phenylacetate-coenzyme A ligase PaaK-like adenylate-forming protein